MSDAENVISRRQFCTGACSATILSLFAACGSSPSSPSSSGGGGGTAVTLGTSTGTLANNSVQVTVSGIRAGERRRRRARASVAGVFLLARTSDSAFTAIDAVCTHEGCTVTGADGAIYVCPCHGSRYNRNGQVVAGPAHSVAASVHRQLRRRRRDDRALITPWPNSTRKSITCFAAPASASAPRTSRSSATCRRAAAVDYLVDYEGRPDDVDARIGRPDHAQVDDAGPLRAGHRHRRRAAALAVPHDPLAAPAAGKDGAVLAQPLRHGLQQADRRLRQHAGGEDARAQTRRAARAAGTDRALPPVRARQLPRSAAAGGAGSRDARSGSTGRSTRRAKPQENFGREIIELFTIGVGNYTEPDVYAAARVFTGWNLRRSDDYRQDEYGDLNAYQEFVYNADQHETSAKTFSFPIYADGSQDHPGAQRSRRACRTAST